MPRKNRRRPDGSNPGYPTCAACRQRIAFVRMTETGASLPVDPFPDPQDGNVCAAPSRGSLAGWVISRKKPAVRGNGYKLYRAHFGTCPAAPRPGQPAPPRKPAQPEPSTLFD